MSEDNLVQATSVPADPQCDQLHAAEALSRDLAYFKDMNVKLEAALRSKDEAMARIRGERNALRSRLQITHAWRLSENGEDVERFELSPEEAKSFPDGIAVRDASLEFMRQHAARQAARIKALETALEPFVADWSAAIALNPYVAEWRETDPLSVNTTVGHLNFARSVLSGKPQEAPKPSEGDFVAPE